MKLTVLCLLLLLFSGCKKNGDSSGLTDPSSDTPTDIKPADLSLFDISGTSLDSTHQYGGGDCFGDIYHFSSSDLIIDVDSMKCGEYGFTFTHYILDENESLKAARELKWESIMNEDATAYVHVLSEHIYDFRQDPSVFLMRGDTLKEHFIQQGGYPHHVSQPFDQTEIQNYQTTYEQLSEKRVGTWGMNLVD